MKDNPDGASRDPTKPLPERGQAIFEGALQLPPDQRAGYVVQACPDDAQLRQQIELLLHDSATAGEFLEGPVESGPNKTIVLSDIGTEKPGDKIGRYKLLQQLGEGGCGVVYMAEQEEPVRRRVALKVIKLGMDTKSVIARFEAERQALALMDHPNIAKVLDAGATEIGRPFFVMELVRGIRINEYCDQNKLSTEERLRLFIQVCHAIQHAHQKGIIHRDIKPSNILVTLHDGVPVPKVIDFGIAKATQGRLTDQTLFTAFEQFIGTPAYMSPEQAEMSGLDIDTRCDIYALGVLLYELLTGQTPFDAKELAASGLDKMRQIIREKEPERPSTRLSTMLSADQTAAARHRRTDPPKLVHMLRGDLDWIVMKALEKDRTRRFETANGLASDVQRYLNDEAVEARPPSKFYRFQKLARRNRAVFGAVGAAMAALVAGLALSLHLFMREKAARQRAVAAEMEQFRLRQQAERDAEIGLRLGQAGMLLTRNQFDEAERLISDVPPHASMVPFFSVFGQIHGRRGHWQAAKANYSHAVQFLPSDHVGYHYLAPVFLQVGDVEGYQQHRQRMLRQFSETSDPVIAERIAKDCLILPPATPELAVISKMAKTAIAANPASGYFEFVQGFAEYRQGQWAAAADQMQQVVSKAGDRYRTGEAFMVLAMAQYQLHQMEEARATLAKGVELVETSLPNLEKNTLDEQWNDWIIVHLLMRESRTLIQPGNETK